MFCQNCGKNLEDGVTFCSTCGCKIDVDFKSKALNNDKLLSKEEFIFSKPYLKAKHDKIRNAKIFNEIITIIVWLITLFIVYKNYDDSLSSNFAKWIIYNPKEILVPMIVALIVSFFVTILVNMVYADAPKKELENTYDEYVVEYRQIERDNNINAVRNNNVITVNNTNTWVCPNCGKVNQNYVGTCGCGTRKP